jgi:hypothetical protein
MATKREHEPGPIRRPSRPYGKLALTCSCGTRVTSTNTRTDDGIWSAFRQHVNRVQIKEHKAREFERLATVQMLTEEIAKAALHLAKLSNPVQLAKLEDGLRLTLAELEEAATYHG